MLKKVFNSRCELGHMANLNEPCYLKTTPNTLGNNNDLGVAPKTAKVRTIITSIIFA